ncbi:MAG: PfkB family carbohydrate kinase [Syntrophomonas sp.]|nr:PfkB family carbohydrate kinase [Syntrophomonas sp.]
MKLTSRESEIAEFLRKEPLISQDELALHFGISRSSVAVHISNLMKKGIILGKGYVFNKKVSVVIVGQVFLEIRVQGELDNTVIDMKYTGFAAEVSKALAGYGIKSKIITVIGNDELGNDMVNDLKAKEVDIGNIYRHPQKRTCKKIVSDKGLCLVEGYNTKDFQQAIEAREWVASNCDWLVVEPEFQEAIVRKLPGREDQSPCLCGCWFLNDEIPAFLGRCDLLAIGVNNFQKYDCYLKKARKLVEAGTQNCIITDGSNSAVLINNQGVSDFPLPPNQSFNSQTGMHFFLAGLVYGLSVGYPIRQAIRIASGTANSGGEKP